MAIQDEISNTIEDRGGQTVVYCLECGDPDGHEVEMANDDGTTRTEYRPPTGYAPLNLLKPLGWVKAGDGVVCGNPACLAAVSGEDEDEIRALGVTQETITPEEVAARNPISVEDIDSLDELDDPGGKVTALRENVPANEDGGEPEEE